MTEIIPITILARLSPRLCNKMQLKNGTTLFVDYCPASLPKGTYKVTAIGNRLIEGLTITIGTIRDQFNNDLENIPEGWRTICELEFDKTMSEVMRLKEAEGFAYTQECVCLCVEVRDSA